MIDMALSVLSGSEELLKNSKVINQRFIYDELS